MKEHGIRTGVRSVEKDIPLAALKAEKQWINCNHGNNGRIHLLPMLNGEPAPNATGLVAFSAQLRGMEDSIPHGVVDVSKIGSADGYERPRWGSISYFVGLIESDPTGAPLAGFDELRVIVERW
ncbi:hypothetical protein LRP50_05240 [Enterovibrio sp. ZSDZ42]|uniref:Uncharacterized protein n=1 Tax=Enterovibrio gelatinilyticus TaxID=2899819 RepID=A0ABT5QWY1_9GAMM|nr:hypothetical protein [Enterovibrio sp. ZSDZ42]MDD1792532.1 hypothetical protein [Enterovibrio sp. ZSDZ42]